ncbi:MAG: hypothetical protein HY912_02380 [Desulfomonile tiedjei]|uniref:Tetratricopeptide repeat protein n=1 Tax=Desulfomonile tiedjei TaxID=2358 RepID=A0A9D6V355_9BACT|nr:hypothetical protein [Desulfomonile tiedjei]
MSDTESKGTQSVCEAAALPVEQALARVEDLVANSDFDGALALLSALEQDYVRGARLFDLLGDIFVQRGETQLGVRYKVLHEVLRGTFRIAMEETQHHRELVPPEAGEIKPRSSVSEVARTSPDSEQASVCADFMPVTAAMGHELMRQGHYDQALQIFTTLLIRNPQDLSLMKAQERARKRVNEKRIVGVLRGWLGNLDRIKSDRSTGV